MLSLKQDRWFRFGLVIAALVVALFVTSILTNRSANALGSSRPASQIQVAATAAPADSHGQPQKALSPEEIFWRRYHLAMPQPTTANPSSVSAATSTSSSLSKGVMKLSFRGIGLNRTVRDSAADQLVAGEVLEQIHRSPLFDSASAFEGKLSEEEPPGTFTFTIAAKLKKPLEL